MSTLDNGNSQPNDPTDPIYCGFTVGQHVACVSDPTKNWLPIHFELVPNLPTVNKVYTVRCVFLHPWDEIPCLRLAELINPARVWNVNKVGAVRPEILEPGFAARCFRPLKKLRIEDFRSGDAPIDHRVLEGVRA